MQSFIATTLAENLLMSRLDEFIQLFIIVLSSKHYDTKALADTFEFDLFLKYLVIFIQFLKNIKL